MLANWHMPISVVPGKANARNCSIKARGAGASTVRVPVVGQPLSCILSTADAHGNMRHAGGATVSPVVIRPDGEETSKAKVCATRWCDALCAGHSVHIGYHAFEAGNSYCWHLRCTGEHICEVYSLGCKSLSQSIQKQRTAWMCCADSTATLL